MGFEHFGKEPFEKQSVESVKYPDSSIDFSRRPSLELPGLMAHSPMLEAEIQESKEKFAPNMEIQAEKIKEVYDGMPELWFDTWKTFDLEKRTKLLQSFEEKIAPIEKRKAMPVKYEQMGGKVNGYLDQYHIAISEKLVGSNQFSDYKKTLNTLFHEGRHAYQNHNLCISRTESSNEIYNSWKINEEKLGYKSGDTSFPLNLFDSFREKNYHEYYTQPVEVDARVFAETVENKICLKAG